MAIHRKFRFSVGTLLFLILCLCGYLSGRRQGYEDGKALWNIMPVYTVVYGAGDLLEPDVDLEQLASIITQEVVPECWEGGNCLIKPFPKNDSLVIQANRYIHDELSQHLKSLRDERVASID